MKKILYITFSLCLSLNSCINDEPTANPANTITYGDGYMSVQLNTDKAVYKPGETVFITLNKLIDTNVIVRYKHLNTVLNELPLTNTSWEWTPPQDDFKGYLIDLYSIEGGQEKVHGSIAVDVSSDMARFPRNGFLSTYGLMNEKNIKKVIDNLNRHHINYVQYQDWHYKHHWPLAGTAASPMDIWTDIISRDCYKSTVQGYIDETHNRGMKSIFYNLAYGALNDAAEDGVKEEWYIFKDAKRGTKDNHPLGSPFKSSIYLVNSGNPEWKEYIGQRNDDVYSVFDFDGYQIDQLGDRGNVYDYYGNPTDLSATFPGFIKSMKEKQPDKSLVMNAVGQWGQEGIATSPVDFLYTEIWDHSDEDGYNILSTIITDNDRMSGGKKTILAAYLNYELGRKGRGYFNTPGILMCSAAIHAWGGAHLQLGEHMLCNEYFPNNNLTMKGELKKAIVKYYDFITAYENLLRDGGEFIKVDAQCTDNQVSINRWPPVKNQIATVGKRIGKMDVVHLLNYTNATHLDWCDTDGNQGEPTLFNDVKISIPVSGNVRSVWMASPDVNDGVASSLVFSQETNSIVTQITSLKYWDMIVIEYE